MRAAVHGRSMPTTSPETHAASSSSSAGLGFAAAVTPVTATTQHTNDDGIVAGFVEIAIGGDRIPVYRAAPRTGSSFPTVLVIQEIFGVHEHIQDVSRRLAKLGYLALAPELYHRQGDVSQLKELPEIRAVVSRVPDAQVLADLDATLRWAREQGQGDPQKQAITGFCWGGRITWLYAAKNPFLKAAVAWYGRLNGDRSPLQPAHPIDIAAQLRVPVLGLYGAEDQGIPLGDVESFRAAVKGARVTDVEIQVYPGAPHAFFADYRPSYRAEPATDAWHRLQDWFRKHGVAPA